MEYQQKKFSFVLVLGFIILFGVGLGYGYYFSQNNRVEAEVAEFEKQVTEIQNQLKELRESDTVSAQSSVNALTKIEQDEVVWSGVLSTLRIIVPLDLAEKKPLVEFTSYSGSESGSLTFNGHTNPSSNVKKQLNAISETIKAFNSTSAFANAFVPSISKSVTQDDEIVLSFIFNVDYIPSAVTTEVVEESIGDLVDELVTESDAVSVPRN